MMIFPHKILTSSGHEAIVTNPAQGYYHFEVTEKDGNRSSFEWYESSYNNKRDDAGLTSSTVWSDQYDILEKFWAEQDHQ